MNLQYIFYSFFSLKRHCSLKNKVSQKTGKLSQLNQRLSTTLCLLSLFTFINIFLMPSHALAEPVPILSLWGTPPTIDINAPMPYLNPHAPKGGTLNLSTVGTFDNLNPFSPRGITPHQMSYTYEALAEVIDTKNNIIRGVLAESFDLNEDRSILRVYLRENALFADGTKVTAHDVVYTFNALMEQASPLYRNAYIDVEKIYAESEHVVVYEFSETRSRDLALAVCRLPVLPQHLLENRDLGEPSKDFIQGSGPYRVKSVNFGSQLVLERRKDYWGKDLIFNQGRYNFDIIKIDFFRDATIARQAFFAGDIDFYSEGSIKDWVYAYDDMPAVENEEINRMHQIHELPIGMMGLVFNTRKTVLSDKRVRQAISLLMDFEWINRTLFYNSHTRCSSYFTGHDFNFQTKPSPEELALLLPYKDSLDPAVFGDLPEIPVTDGSGNVREQMMMAVELLQEAGWELKDGIMRDKNGNHLRLDFIIPSATYQRTYTSFQKNLSRIGIELNIQLLDQTQYYNRMHTFDYDLIYTFLSQTGNPGNEQRNFWTSAAADRENSKNYAGIKDPVIDALTEKLIAADTKQEMQTAANALNRVLMHGHYVIPGWYKGGWRIAWWKDRLHPGNPEKMKTSAYESWYSLKN